MAATFKTTKRTTAFNAFCSKKLKENPQSGFQSVEWGREWKSLSQEQKKEYESMAFTLRNKSLDVKAIVKNIQTMFNKLRENEEEAKAAGIEAMCTIAFKNGALHCTGFGCLGDLLKNKILYDRLMGFVNTGPSECGKETIKELREKVVVKMSKIAKSQLGLSHFPYERVKNGEFCVTGVPPCLLPLQPPSQLTTKQLQELLRTEVSVIRIPRIPQQTQQTDTHVQDLKTQTDGVTQQTDTHVQELETQTDGVTQQTDTHVQELETQTDGVTQQTDTHVQELETQTDGVTQQTDTHVQELETQTDTHVQELETQTDGVTQQTDTHVQELETQTDGVTQQTDTHVQELETQTDGVTQQTDTHVQELETQTDSAVQHITDMQQNTAIHVGTTTDSTDIQPAEMPGNVTVDLLPSQPPRQDTAGQPQPSGSLDLPKAKRTRVTWDANSIKALEESLGSLEAITCIPSGKELKTIRQSKPALQKFDISQIYKKLYKIKSKKK